MLFIVTKEQILSPEQVCPGCVLASSEGLPRWQQGKLKCGQCLEKSNHNQPTQYKCQMGFSLVEVE